MFKVILVGTLCVVCSSAYLVLNDTLSDYDSPVETTSYKYNFFNHHYNMLSREDTNDAVDAITKSYKEAPKIVQYEPKTVLKATGGKPPSTADLSKLLLKNGAHPNDNKVEGALSKENAELLSKYKNGIPYYVTKNDDILGAGDVGTLPNVGQPAPGDLPNMGQVAGMGPVPSLGNLGSEKLNFSVGNYMKFLTRNTSLTTADVYKYVFSKKCSKEYNLICLKLDLIKILSNINNDNNRSISIIPHLMSISINNNSTVDPMSSNVPMTVIPDQDASADESTDYANMLTQRLNENRDFVDNKELYESMVLKNNYNTNYFINNILKKKIIGLLNNMTLNIKLFDNTTIGIIRKLVHGYGGGEDVKSEEEKFDGRGEENENIDTSRSE